MFKLNKNIIKQIIFHISKYKKSNPHKNSFLYYKHNSNKSLFNVKIQ